MPLDTSAISRMVASYGFKAGIAEENGQNVLSPHDLRRSAARRAFDGGASIVKVSKMLGHSDVKTTMRYIGSEEDDDHTAIDYLKW